MKNKSLISAEMIGTAAVVLSLIFVGIEIRDGNREARAATTQAALDAEMVWQAQLVQYADVWESVIMNAEAADEVAMRRAIALFNMVMTLNDNRFQMMNSGYVDYSAGALRQIVALPFFEIWRQSTGAAGRSPEFLAFVDAMRESND